jgi:hypothetical protein
MDQEQFHQASERLTSCAQTLANHVRSDLPQAADALSGKTPLPDGCPSGEALAEWCLRNVAQDIVELMRAFDDMHTAIGVAPRFVAKAAR